MTLSKTSAREGRGLALVVSAMLLVGCGDDGAAARDGGPVDGGGRDGWVAADGGSGDAGEGLDANVPEGLCPVTLTYRATDSTPRVFVAGGWNGFSESAEELRDDGTGTYAATLLIEPGLHPYKLVVRGDGREPWRLDPRNHYRAYAGGVENSGLRVPDCRTPALEVERAEATRPAPGGGRIDATLRYDRWLAGPLGGVRGELRSGGAWTPLPGGAVSADGAAVTLTVTGLDDGKHTVRLVAADTSGVESDSVLLPVWIEPEPFAWDDGLVYMVMTDRFRNGDPTNDPAPTSASPGADFHGGDLWGVAQAIREGYMDELGVTALWLTPFNTNPVGVYDDADGFHGVTAYHGYWPTEPRAVDGRIGGEEALDELVAAAHERGIRVLMDLVLNHVHEDHPYVSEHPDWFNEGCICGTGGCDWTERRLDCLFRPYMPDVDWTNPAASEQMVADALWWMERFDLDGFRVDAVKHVVDGAVFNLSIRVRERFETASTHHFLMGETAMGWDSSAGPTEGGNVENYGTISRYLAPRAHGLDGQFDFVLYYAAAMQLLGDAGGRGMAHVDYWTRASLEQYPRGSIMTPYIGSHDSSRWISLQAHPGLANNKWSDLPPRPTSDEPYDRMYVALAWIFAIPGAPLLYYGDEYGEHGGADPDNRHPMRFGSALSAREQAQLARVRALGRARAQLPGLRRGGYRTLHADEDLWVVARGEGDELVVVAVHKAAVARSVVVPVPRDVAPEGRTFTDTLGSGTSARVERAALSLTLPARSALYLR